MTQIEGRYKAAFKILEGQLSSAPKQSQLSKLLNILQSSLDEVIKRLQSCENQINTLNEEKEFLASKATDSSKVLEMMKGQIEGIDNEKTSLESEKLILAGKLRQMEKLVPVQGVKSAKKDTQMNEVLVTQISGLKIEIGQKDQQIKLEQQKSAEKISKIHAENFELMQKIKVLEGGLKGAKDLQTINQKLKSELEEHKALFLDKKSGAEELTRTLSVVENEREEKSQKLALHSQTIELLTTEKDSMNVTLSVVEEEVRSLRREISEMGEKEDIEIKRHEREIESMRMKWEERGKEIESAKEDMSKMKGELEERDEDNTQLQEDIDELKERTEGKEKELSDIRAGNSELIVLKDRQIDNLNMIITERDARIEELDITLAKNSAELAKYRTEITELEIVSRKSETKEEKVLHLKEVIDGLNVKMEERDVKIGIVEGEKENMTLRIEEYIVEIDNLEKEKLVIHKERDDIGAKNNDLTRALDEVELEKTRMIEDHKRIRDEISQEKEEQKMHYKEKMKDLKNSLAEKEEKGNKDKQPTNIGELVGLPVHPQHQRGDSASSSGALFLKGEGGGGVMGVRRLKGKALQYIMWKNTLHSALILALLNALFVLVYFYDYSFTSLISALLLAFVLFGILHTGWTHILGLVNKRDLEQSRRIADKTGEENIHKMFEFLYDLLIDLVEKFRGIIRLQNAKDTLQVLFCLILFSFLSLQFSDLLLIWVTINILMLLPFVYMKTKTKIRGKMSAYRAKGPGILSKFISKIPKSACKEEEEELEGKDYGTAKMNPNVKSPADQTAPSISQKPI